MFSCRFLPGLGPLSPNVIRQGQGRSSPISRHSGGRIGSTRTAPSLRSFWQWPLDGSSAGLLALGTRSYHDPAWSSNSWAQTCSTIFIEMGCCEWPLMSASLALSLSMKWITSLPASFSLQVWRATKMGNNSPCPMTCFWPETRQLSTIDGLTWQEINSTCPRIGSIRIAPRPTSPKFSPSAQPSVKTKIGGSRRATSTSLGLASLKYLSQNSKMEVTQSSTGRLAWEGLSTPPSELEVPSPPPCRGPARRSIAESLRAMPLPPAEVLLRQRSG